MKVKIIERPSGHVRIGTGELVEWPEVGKTMDLPDVVAEGMIATGAVEKVGGGTPARQTEKVEKRPAPAKATETRKRKV